MENINDVEFGSNKSTEEAPILVAQRYLNIFRQIHIFNKQKRDQFDDELLNLPANIIEFVKKMPGGRLLIEHIEDVKTERGISFVKSQKEDFVNEPTASGATASISGAVPMVGGNLVMDSSFAETLASSMAKAFAQAPAAISTSSGATISADLGPAFKLLAEEIRSSRTSLLDVLKETRNITDSVIATQVAISRILEGVLSFKNQGGTVDTSDLSNHIVASQNSITKLLENLYNSSTKKNEEISNYLDVDAKLQSFRNELSQTVLKSLQNLTTQVVSSAQERPVSSSSNQNFDAQLSQFKGEVNKSLSEMRHMLHDCMNSSKQSSHNIQTEDTDFDDDDSEVISEEFRKKKKKKKKKNHDAEGIAPVSPGFVPASKPQSFENPVNNANIRTPSVQDKNLSSQIVGGVIKNPAYKNEDDFSHINPNVLPIEANGSLGNDVPQATSNPSQTLEIDDILSGLDDIDFSEEPNSSDQTDSEDISSLDDLGFTLPEEETENTPDPAPEPQVAPKTVSLDDFGSDDDLESSLSPSDSEIEQTGLDDFGSSDDLDISLPEDDTKTEPTSEPQVEPKLVGLDDFGSSDDLDISLPQDDTKAETALKPQVTSESASLDDFESSDDLDISLPQGDTEAETALKPQATSESASLNDFESDDDLDISLPQSDVDEVEEDEPDTSVAPTSSSTGSRYSAELDRIRSALTSDNIDLSSLDEPIALDDYSDDENVPSDTDALLSPSTNTSAQETSETTDDQDWEYEYVDENDNNDDNNSENPSSDAETSGQDWEWEYVDENGNVASTQSDENNEEDWEWEYVDENDEPSNNENNPQ